MDKIVFSNTIVAISSALGEGAVGVVRLSGDKSLEIANKVLSKPLAVTPRLMQLRYVLDGAEKIDEVLAVYMPGPHSYTAEDVVELQCHGSLAALEKILSLCVQQGATLAEPGEFTKRAFLNGHIDLTQAEAVMDIIKAKSTTALQMALRAQQGELGNKIRSIRNAIIDSVVLLEAKIDYPEDDIEETTYAQLEQALQDDLQEVDALLATGRTGRIFREGLQVAIVGRPNVGKSSLLNALLQEERAIVTDVAGTTRDVIEEQLLIEGIPVVLSDTAGLHHTDDCVEKIGVERSRSTLSKADLILCVLDGSEPLQQEDKDILADLADKQVIVVWNKSDLGARCQVESGVRCQVSGAREIQVSAKTGAGIADLRQQLKQFAYKGNAGDQNFFVQNVRHLDLLKRAQVSLSNALTAAQEQLPYDCITIDLKDTIGALGEITGDAVTDEVINKIFAKFCIGK